MQISSSQLAAQSYSEIRSLQNTSIQEGGTQEKRDLAQEFIKTLEENEKTISENLVSNADPHSLVKALAETELAIETTVTVRNKVVEAYQEILRMPV